ncbi:MAG TPA: vitamin K epoxide reductase family protein [Candidatus Limnocylindria bacterium]|nr:vitamin K epoxide reductase family protein [Candidatus Limnocylindria bacterium]
MANDRSRKGKQPPARAILRAGPNWPLFVLAVLGMLLSAYLTYSAWQSQLVAFCTVGSDCDVVLNSRWSTLLGMPTSFWGFLTYGLLAAVAWNKNAVDQWLLAWVISLFGLIFSVYLTLISFFELKAACPYCLVSLGLMAAIFILTTFQRPNNIPQFSWGAWLAKSAGAGLVVILALHLHYAGYWGSAPGPEDPWVRGLAEHLTKTEAKFYGASWCPHCQDQKKLFGNSDKRVPYVECSPAGPNGPVAPACKERNINSYPTWIINGQRHTGVQPLDALAKLSQYQYQPEGDKS